MIDPSRTRFRFVKRILYQLKRKYGLPLDIYHIISVTSDTKSGTKTVNKTKYHIRRAILLPTILRRKMAVELGLKPTGYGPSPPGYDIKERLIIIDNDDLPDVDLNAEDYLVIDHERHDIKSIEELENKRASVFTTRVVEGGEANEIFIANATNTLVFAQSAGTVP